ncbi:energy transducer TonB [Sphingobium sp. EM0848]|uniref:energy transducer TonB n=1 Tax=Sphingobium sp. EM0848 TaxID=2743473 RepID=UPI00159C4F04|nr:energy transducer TonB [Sphingobium sp. EM0848]
MQLMTLRTTEGVSGYQGGRRSPFGIGGAIAVHALVAGIFLMMPKEMIQQFTDKPFVTYDVPETVPPPPEKPAPETDRKVPSRPSPEPTTTKAIVDTPTSDFTINNDLFPTLEPGKGTDTITPPFTPPAHEALLVDPSIDPRALAMFQPDYPGAMIRQGTEGTVTVRVTIGADGRVLDIERLSATDDAFWLATQRHALHKWRFRPATRDGVAVSSSKVLTVRFRLADV